MKRTVCELLTAVLTLCAFDGAVDIRIAAASGSVNVESR